MRLEGKPRQLADRQQEIFEIVVEEFIKSARPVGSEFLSENYDLEVSPATIRNDLAYLEELGFLAKPHTSGGRIPTARGWHFFTHEIREPDRFSTEEIARLNALTNKLLNISQEIMLCVSKIFPEVSDEFFKKFLINKLFDDHGRRK
ncbi:MAG: Heat-inducible transcription repressor hrcA [Candidatus Azambacteria bacterium GW2011_GWA2_39_10]|uniref:Heat-inducible transcription repressor hrcA n=1 Tax=Candidatus Azambacteria bacterium GW2011_GWA2_39_10 TaxID=1618611 RepID=A0A0G0PSG2_9BACT|nr:MAG: Heat-inducible transcription repressor hrcA [Candidatus Azambacteria bacterium GW2011_GWA2_39_10]